MKSAEQMKYINNNNNNMFPYSGIYYPHIANEDTIFTAVHPEVKLGYIIS